MKTFFAFGIVALAGNASGSSLLNQDYQASLNVQKPSMELNSPNLRQTRKPGYTYADTFHADVSSMVEVLGMEVDTIETMQIENEMTVKDAIGGVLELSVLTTRVFMEMKTTGVDLICDSSNEKSSDPICAEMFELVGTTLDLKIDDDGNIVEANGPNAEAVNMMSALIQGDDAESDKDQDEAANQLQQQLMETSRLLQFIPDRPVGPGDSWKTSVDLGDLGLMEGVTTLLGYKSFDGSECAVLLMEGKFDMHLEKLLDSLGLDDGTVSIENADNIEANMTQAIYWDYNENLARWSQANTSYVLEMKNPLDGSTMEVPSTTTSYTMTRIKEKGPSTSNAPEVSSEQETGSTGSAWNMPDTLPPQEDSGHAAFLVIMGVVLLLAVLVPLVVFKRGKGAEAESEECELTNAGGVLS